VKKTLANPERSTQLTMTICFMGRAIAIAA